MKLRARVGLRHALSALVIGVCAATSTSSEAALIHRWSFNDGTAKDSVGNAHGSLENGAGVVNGQLVLTDGVAGPYVELPASGPAGVNINTYPNITIQGWYTGPFNTATPPAPVDPNGFRSLVMFGKKVTQPGGEVHPTPTGNVTVGEGAGADYLMIQPWRNGVSVPGTPNGVVRGAITNASSSREVFGDGPEQLDGLEHLYTLTVTDTAMGADVRLYIDGVQVGTTGVGAVKMSDLSNATAYIGRALYNDPLLNGLVNDVRIYNVALSPADVAASFSLGPNGAPVPEPATVVLVGAVMLGAASIRRRG